MLRAAVCLLALAACRPPPRGDGTCHGGLHACGNTGIDPDTCGALDANDSQRKVHAVLAAAAEIDRASIELDDTVRKTCLEMGAILDVQADGDTGASCDKVAHGLDAALAASIQGDAKLVTKVTPGQCEAVASLDVAAALHAGCTEPAIAVERAGVTVTDDAKLQQATNAIQAGLPRLLLAQKRIEVAAPAIAAWAEQANELQANADAMVVDLGEQAICVGNMLRMLHDSAPVLQAKVTVSVEASAKIAASAGAQAQ